MKKYYKRDEGVVELTQHDGYLTYPIVGGGEDRAPCMMFLLCGREAIGTSAHPLLGDVPSCARCAARLEADLDIGEVG